MVIVKMMTEVNLIPTGFAHCVLPHQTALLSPGGHRYMGAVAKTRVANVLLALKLRGGAVDGAATAAQDIARSSAREALAPLMDAATARLASILRATFDIALDALSTHPGARIAGGFGGILLRVRSVWDKPLACTPSLLVASAAVIDGCGLHEKFCCFGLTIDIDHSQDPFDRR